MKNKIIKFLSYGMILSTPLIIFSCYPGGVEYYSDTDIILTKYDDQHNFNTDHTYYMEDTVFHVVKEGDEDKVDHQFDDQILDRVANNMLSSGYTRITDTTSATPEVAMIVSVLTSKYTGVAWWPGWGGGWYPGYPGWGGPWYPGYPWYPGGGYPTSYTYSTGTLGIDMAEPETFANDTVNIVWSANINGLLSSSESNTSARIDKNIDQAFAQSAYLIKN